MAARAAALNPMDGNAIAFLGELLTYPGDAERGLALAGRAKQLNPHHPGWYWYADVYDAYRQGDYRGTVGLARKVNMPGHWGGHMMIAAACGQLGEREAAGRALRDLLELRPDFAAIVRQAAQKWWAPEYVERLIDGLRKAGLEVPAAEDPPEGALSAGPEPELPRPHIIEGLARRGGRDRRAALLGHEPGQRPGVPLRGHGRGDHERARARRRDPRGVAHLGLPRAARRAATCRPSPARCRWATSSTAACAPPAAGFGSRRS